MNFDKSEADSRSNIRHLKQYGPGGVFLDLGANVGFVSQAALQQFDSVVAVEAHPDTYAQLSQRLADSFAITMNRAVTAESGETMWVSTPENSIGATARKQKRLNRQGYYKEVQSISLQSLINRYCPRVIKMDIEGSEYECISSATFPSSVEWIQVEWHGVRSTKGYDRMLAAERHLAEQKFSRVIPQSISMHTEGYPKALFFVAVYQK